jgi:hypothetical protein
MLCDCPGLVMPSFMFTKAEMVVNGILPIDQMRDHVPPVTLVASLIPRHELELTYGIMLPPPAEGEDPTRPPIAEELLNAYGCMYLSLLCTFLMYFLNFLCCFMLALVPSHVLRICMQGLSKPMKNIARKRESELRAF